MAMFSMSIELIHSPPDLITSLARSVICMMPSGSSVATSPVSKKPHGSQALALLVARAGVLEIGARDRGAAHQQAAERLAVVRLLHAFIVDDLHLDRERRAALLHLGFDLAFVVHARSARAAVCRCVPIGLISVMPQAWMTSTP